MLLKMYDGLCGAEDDEDFVVNHIYASVFEGDNGDLCIAVRNDGYPGAIPLTIVWGQR